MRARRSVLETCVVVLLWTAGCVGAAACHSPYRVVSRGEPNPLRAGYVFAIEPIQFDGMTVGDFSEADWLGRKSVFQRESWESDKEAFSRRFAARLIGHGERLRFRTAEPVETEAIVIRSRVEHVETGIFVMPLVRRATQMRVDVQLLSGGVPFEQLSIHSGARARWHTPSVGGRMREAGEHLADRLYQYLLARSGRG